ncbi:MAG TPA: hypothetical protein VMT10_10835 [Solirubrobacteraceae bacterium]|nr:hypothetical protein [Solirubrobacteraceae bacterium]
MADPKAMSSRSSAHTGLLAAAGGAAAVLASLWLPWYLIRIPQAFRDALSSLGGGQAQPGVAPNSPGAQLGAALGGVMKGIAAVLPSQITGNGWQVMHGGDVALAIVAGAALLVALAVGGGLSGVAIEPGTAGRFVAALGGVAVGIAGYHVVQRPGMGAGALSADVSVKYGIYVAILGGLAMIGGGLAVGRATVQPAKAASTFAPPMPPMGTGGPSSSLPWDTATSAPPPGV